MHVAWRASPAPFPARCSQTLARQCDRTRSAASGSSCARSRNRPSAQHDANPEEHCHGFGPAIARLHQPSGAACRAPSGSWAHVHRPIDQAEQRLDGLPLGGASVSREPISSSTRRSIASARRGIERDTLRPRRPPTRTANASSGNIIDTLHLDLDDLPDPDVSDRLHHDRGQQQHLAHALAEEQFMWSGLMNVSAMHSTAGSASRT